MITVSDVVSLEKRGTYQGIIGVVVALSNSIGPLVGGIFTEKVTWRWCFVSSCNGIYDSYPSADLDTSTSTFH